MSRSVRLYLALLSALVLGWLVLRAEAIAEFGGSAQWPSLLGVIALYLLSHVFRMLRLALLTLGQHAQTLPLIAAHALTAFPSSFLPFKIGEILRLTAFFHVFGWRRIALSIWLVERFGDVVVIAAFILGLYVFNISVPPSMRVAFILFVLVTLLGLLGLFAVAKFLVYFNRHLVLASHTTRGLLLLRAGHVLRLLELDIYRSVEGRFAGFLLLSVLIWCMEILAFSLFISPLSIGAPDFLAMFLSGLLASLPGSAVSGAGAFGLYQSLVLVALTLLFLAAVWLAAHLRITRK